MTMKIRIGNDFVFNWAIERGGLPEDLSSVLEKHLHLSVFGKRVELIEGVDYDITGNVIRIEVTPTIANIIGTYKAEFHYILPDNGLIDEDRKCAVDVDAFQIVAKTAQADDSTEFSMTSDMAIAFKGDDGDSAYKVWLEEGNIGTEEDYIAYLRQPAVDAGASISELEGEIQVSEDLRVQAENERDSAEATRIQSESERLSAEIIRQSNEGNRIDNEVTRVQNEAERISEEGVRQSNEVDRIEAEGVRVQAESERAQAEIERQNTIQEAVTATNLANEKANLANTAAQSANEAAGLADTARTELTTAVNTKLGEADDKIEEMDTTLSTYDGRVTQVESDITQLAGDVNLKELNANKQNSLEVDGTGTKFPTVDAVNAGLAGANNLIARWVQEDNIDYKVITAFDHTTGVFTSPNHGFVNGDSVAIVKSSLYAENIQMYAPIHDMEMPRVLKLTVSNANTDTFQLLNDGSPITYSLNDTLDLTKIRIVKESGTYYFTITGLQAKRILVRMCMEVNQYESRIGLYGDNMVNYVTPNGRIVSPESSTNASMRLSTTGGYRRDFIEAILDDKTVDLFWQMEVPTSKTERTRTSEKIIISVDTNGNDITSFTYNVRRGSVYSIAIGSYIEIFKI